SLPHSGPGRQDNGNLHLSEFKLLAAPKSGEAAAPVAIAGAFADFNQDGWGVGAAIDGKPETAWGIFPQVGQSHAAVFVLPEPLMVDAATHDFKPDGNFKPPHEPRAVHVLRRGDINQPLDEARPGALSCLEHLGLPARFAVEHPTDEAGRRAALARWLTD